MHSPIEAPRSMRALFARYRARLLLTYALFNVENVIALLQPAALGFAINELIAGGYVGLAWFVGQHVGHAGIGSCRRAYDTRVFATMYAALAAPLVVAARRGGAETSVVAARAALSRELVDFFEVHVPTIIASLYALVGAAVMLLFFDPLTTAMCVGLLGPLALVHSRAWPRLNQLHQRLNDRLEREVHVIERGDAWRVRGHFGLLARWRIRLSDLEVRNFATMETFILLVIAGALVRFCGAPDATPGGIFAQLMYVVTFAAALDNGPLIVQQVSRIRDIQRRLEELRAEGEPGPADGGP